MRIRGAKTELEEAGLETDGMAESTSKLREEILALSGVDIMIDDSTFKSTYDIVLELAQIWDTLTDVSQANISELLAGKRGGNVINSLMTNADLLEETYATALGSEGSAEKELENYQQGVQYSIDVFKASWEELSNTILSSDLMKTVIDIGSGIVSTVNSIISSLGGLTTAFAAVPLIGFLSNFKELKSLGLETLGQSTAGFAAGFTSNIGTSTKQVNGLTAAMTGLGVKVKDVATSFASTAGWGGAILAIGGIGAAIAAVEIYMNRFDNSVDTALESLNNFQTEQENLEGLESQTDDIKSELESLAGTYEIDVSGMDDVDSMIDKIESVDTLSITDKATLEDLRSQNAELERQIALQEKVVETAQSEAQEDALKTVTMHNTPDLSQKTTRYTLYGQAVESYANEDVITATQNELDRLDYLHEKRQEAIQDSKTQTGDILDDTNKRIAGYDNEINTLENAVTSQLESLSSIKESLADVDGEYYDQITSMENQFANMDLSPLEKQLASIDDYFSTDGMDAVKDAIMDAVSSGETATDAFREMGLSLGDIGNNLDPSTFNAYFDDLVAGAEEAEEAINSVEGTLESMQTAAGTENQNANWESAAKLLADAQDLYEQGLVGTDDFKEAVQYMTHNPINPDEAQFEFDSDAYVAAWEKAQDKVNRYFNADNPIQSMQNTLDDLVDAGLATDEGEGLYEWTKGFENTAQAADAFDMSLSATEDLLNGLKAYGFEFDDVFFSGEGLDEYSNYLNSLKSTYDSMSEGQSKNRLGELIEGFDEDYAKYEDDISQLDKNAIVHIQFEYDLASIEAEVQTFRDTIENGDKTASNYAKLMGKNQEYIDTAKEGAGLNVEGVSVPMEITGIDDQITGLKQQLANATKESEKMEIQAEIINLQELEKNLLTAFSSSDYGLEINADSSIEEVQSAWEGFLSSVDGRDLIANIDVNDEQAVAAISELTGLDGDTIREYIVADNSDAISKFAELETLAGDNIHVDITGDASSVAAELEAISAGNTLVFTANVDGVETAIAGMKTVDGEIIYTVDENVDTDAAKKAINEITGEDVGDITISPAVDTNQAMQEISRMNSAIYDNDTEFRVKANTDEVQNKVNESRSEIENEEAEIPIDGNPDGAESAADEAESYADSKEAEIPIDGNPDGAESAADEAESYADSKEAEIPIGGDARGAESAADEAANSNVQGTITYIADTATVSAELAAILTQEGNITFTADTSGVESAISEYQNQEGTIKFTGDAGGVESAISGYKEQEGTIKFTGDASGVSSAIAGYKQQTGTITYTANTSGISSALASVLTINGTATVTFSADTSVPESYTPSDKTGNVVFNKDSSIPDNYQPADKNATVHYSADTSSLPTSFPTITRTVNYVATGATGGSSANGTAHAGGTATTLPRLSGNAKASGDVDEWSTEIDDRWRTKKGETTLTGELGRELVVDVNHNRWFTVGDNGAEFTYIPAGSVIFNHKQTEDLLTTGSTDGTAHAQGTAYANGGRLITSSSSSSSSKSSSSSSSSKSSSSSSSKKKSSSSSKKKSSSSSSSSKDFEESLDWIEIEIDRIERAINRLDLKAESTYNSWTTRNKNLSSEIAKITNEINVQQKAYDRYIKQANSVGLSSKYVKLVQNGTIDISTITDEDLADQIKEYQQWYYLMPFYCIGNRKLSNCWDTPKLTKLKHKDEISLGVNVAKAEKISQMI